MDHEIMQYNWNHLVKNVITSIIQSKARLIKRLLKLLKVLYMEAQRHAPYYNRSVFII